MRHTCIFEASEHTNNSASCRFTGLALETLQKSSQNYLDIAFEEDELMSYILADKSGVPPQPRAGYLIGYRWFEKNKTYLHVKPKEDNGKKIDPLKMFITCLKDPIVSKKMHKSYKIFFDEPFIEIENSKDEITPFLILHFLQVVKYITKKGLKKGYVKVSENLTSKIKGKILIPQTIKHNHLKNRVDKTICSHQIFTTNSIENRMIKIALMQCSKHLYAIANESISKLLRQNLNAFELVEKIDVKESDFKKIKHSPFYKEYKEALSLAWMIFKRFGFSLYKASDDTQHTKIPPYQIDMPELFERYVEVQLRKYHPDIIDGNDTSVASWQMRPDFLLPKSPNHPSLIIDAKYKYWYGNESENAGYKEDYMQLSLYGRDEKVKKHLNEDKDKEVKLLFIYPGFRKNEVEKNEAMLKEIADSGKESSKFTNISKLEIVVPEAKL